MLRKVLLVLGSALVINAKLDFNIVSNSSCNGEVISFDFDINEGERVFVGEVPPGLTGLLIQLRSNSDIDLQLSSGSSEIINWQNGVIKESNETSRTWNNDLITYSGYSGDGSGIGNEYIRFDDSTNNQYRIYAFGYKSGFATVTYTWDASDDCIGDGPSPAGSGTFSQIVDEGQVLGLGELPIGLHDVYIRVSSDNDIDLQLYDGNIAVVNSEAGMLSGSKFQTKMYSGLEIQYSGFHGEQRPGTEGHEYIFIKGVLSKIFSVRVIGFNSGFIDVTYSWGYYSRAISSEAETLKQQLHEIVEGHTQLSYSMVWEALKRTDQDAENHENVICIYSRRSEPKYNQDTGSNGPDAWNREHIYAKAHGDFGTRAGAGTDIHAIRAADKSVNTERSSKDFAEGGTQLTSAEPRDDCPLCKETNASFEPPNDVKGDIARMIFYMVIRYNGDVGSNGVSLNVVSGVDTPYGSSTANNGIIGDLDSLKIWHSQDPVSDEEKHRNNIIFDIQGNRNPFVDNPQFVDVLF